MAESQLYHLGKNGPAPCGARKRVCRYAALPHGEEAQMIAHWEAQQEAKHDDLLTGVSKDKLLTKESQNANKLQLRENLLDSNHYISRNEEFKYSRLEMKVAQKVATDHLSQIGYTKVEKEDVDWGSNGVSSVRRLELEDGSKGYFKSVFVNSEESEEIFIGFGSTALTAAVNEVNAYRLSQAMGAGYDHLVPETSFTVYDGQLGTIQKEAEESQNNSAYKLNRKSLREDYRKAAIFDFVIGNIDRHSENFICSELDGKMHFVLIDNSFSFPDADAQGSYNESIFADNEPTAPIWSEDYDDRVWPPPENSVFTDDEKKSLAKARKEILSWGENGSILKGPMNDAVKRIDHLLESGKMSSLSTWYFEEMNARY